MAYQKKLDCIKMCIQCAHDSAQCAHDCLHLGGEHAAPAHQTLLHDCAEICTLVSHFLTRHSPNAAAVCAACVVICERCADSCERLSHGEGHNTMKHAAQSCRQCAAACSAMAETEIERHIHAAP